VAIFVLPQMLGIANETKLFFRKTTALVLADLWLLLVVLAPNFQSLGHWAHVQLMAIGY
jgi:hypothetical protein